MKKLDIEIGLRESLEGRHWSWQRLCNLPASFSRDIEVTPVFVPHILRKSEGTYFINGYIGIVHQPFERTWTARNSPREGGQFINRYCLMLNISNLQELPKLGYISAMAMRKDIQSFVHCLVSFLERMPHDHNSLVETLRCGELANIPLQNFVVYGEAEKFSELRAFVMAPNALSEFRRQNT